MMGPLFWYALPLALLITISESRGLQRFYPPAKLLASLSFVAVAVYGAVLSGGLNSLWQLLPGLLFCLGGDMALAFYKTRGRAALLLAGMGLFFLAHVAFIRFLLIQQPFTAVDFILPLIMVALMRHFSGLAAVEVGRFRPYVLIYAFCVALFCAKGLHVAYATLTLANLLLGAGSVLFLISDLLLFFRYFHAADFRFLGLLCLLTYYSGMFLIAFSLTW